MTDRFDELVREAAQRYHRPPAVPRDEMWTRIVAERRARRTRRALVGGSWFGWGTGIAALLALGIAIGRWTASESPGTAGRRAERSGETAYRVVATQYLTRTEALLTEFRADSRRGRLDEQFVAQARDLLGSTRLLLDSRTGTDPQLRPLLEDLELVLAQIAQLKSERGPDAFELINQGLQQRSVLPRLRTAIPAGVPPATQGAL